MAAASGHTEQELERLLAAAAQDPALRPAFASALLDSWVLVLGTTAQPDTANLLTLQDKDGPITPFFTSEQMLHATLQAQPGTDPRYLRLPCRSLFEMTQGSRLVLNPHGVHGKIFLPHETRSLLAGGAMATSSEVLAEARTIQVGVPAYVPPALPDTLARFFYQRPVVEAAHLGWVAHPDGHAGFLLAVIATDRDQAMQGLGAIQVGELTGGPTLDVIVVPPGGQNPLGQVVGPFYVRPGLN